MCYAAGDLSGGIFGITGGSGSIGIFSALDIQRPIAGGTFPWSDGGFVAGLQIRIIDRVHGKVMIALDNDGDVKLRYHFDVPDSFHVRVAPVALACGILVGLQLHTGPGAGMLPGCAIV